MHMHFIAILYCS